MELLLSTGRFRSAGFLEILTVLSQLTLYLIGSEIDQISVASRLLMAFTISYIIISVMALYIITSTKKYPVGLGSPVEFINRSRYNHILGASLGFIDRIDRLLVGFLLATPVLGKYAVATTLITLLRFFPDGVSKLIMAKRVTLQKLDRIGKELIVLAGALLTCIVVLFARAVIDFWLGPQWLLGLPIYIAIALQELSRGGYQIVANQRIPGDSSRIVHWAATFTPIFALPVAFLGVGIFGLAAVPSAFCLSYLFGIFIMHRKTML
jgi:hypothetical protein